MILAADFGGTTIKVGLIRSGSVFSRSQLDAHSTREMSERLEAVACEWEALLGKNGFAIRDCTGVALALPFLTDRQHSRVLGEFGKFPGAPAIDFAAWSRARLGLSIVLENDLRLALLGEWTAGAAHGKKDVLMLAFGTGIGCAVISGGALLRGAHNRAATLFGHSSIDYEGVTGRCGNFGCAEDLASTATLSNLAKALPGFGGSHLARIETLDYASVFALAQEGDACSQMLLEQSIKVWATLVQNAVLAYDPEMVVLGGGVLRGREIILPAIEKHLRQHMPGLPLEVPIVCASMADDAALIGGAWLFKQTNQVRSS